MICSKVQHLRNEPQIRLNRYKEEYQQRRLSEMMIRISKNNKDNEYGINDILSLSSTLGIVDRKSLSGDTYSKVNHLNYTKTKLNDFVYGKSISSNYPYGLFKSNRCRDGLLSTLYFTFKTNENYDSAYLDKYFSNNNRANNFLKKYVLVGDRYITADANYILSGKIYVPTLEEQVNVVDFFDVVDSKIKLLEEKLKNLKLFKKGLIEDVYNQLRNEYPMKKLVDVTSRMFSGGTPKSTEKLYYGGNINFLTISDITKSTKNLYNVSKAITQLGLDNSSAKIAVPDTLIYTMYATIAVPIISKIDVAIPQSVMAIQFKEDIDIDFMYYQLYSMTSMVRSKFTETGTQGNINSSIVKNLKLVVPSYKEQTEVAMKLNILESKIELLSSKLETLKQFNIPHSHILQYNMVIFTKEVNT